MSKIKAADFNRAIEIGRPPNVKALFPNSRALLVSGKFIDAAMLKKGHAMTIAANGRNRLVLAGALRAAQKANAAIIIEIAKSEGGAGAYCAVNYWNIATFVDALCNQLGITVPVAVHADHYGIKNDADVEIAKTEIPSLFDAGMTSIAIDASHRPDADNLLSSLALNSYVPKWASLETEVGEIKGKEGMSTVEEAVFLIQGLNAHDYFPDLDRAEQRHHPRDRGERCRNPGRPDRRNPRGPGEVRMCPAPSTALPVTVRTACARSYPPPQPPRPTLPPRCR